MLVQFINIDGFKYLSLEKKPQNQQEETLSLEMLPCTFSIHKLSWCEYNWKINATIIVKISETTIVEKNNPKISLFCHFLTMQNKHLQQLSIYTQKQD